MYMFIQWVMWFLENPVISDLWAAIVCGCVIFAFLGLWKETAWRGLDQVKFFQNNAYFYEMPACALI